MPDYNRLVQATGLSGQPEGMAPLFEAFAKTYAPTPLLRHDFLKEICERFAPGDAAVKRLYAALAEIEGDDGSLMLAHFLVSDICAARHRMDLDDYHALVPEKGMKNKDLYAFLLLIACIEPSMARLNGRGVPPESYQNIPFIPVEKQMNKLRDSGDGSVADFPWDMNFYTCSIFRIGRFYFIPFRLDEALRVYRREEETVAFYAEAQSVRRDGELNGVNHQWDAQAFESAFSESDSEVSGHPIHPAGIIQNQKVALNLSEWTPVLKKGDVLLGFHIPGGPGYDPEHLRDNCSEAYAFYQKWFPEIEVKGFGSESWLYDPHLAHVLGGRGNIPAMQRQMYIYPIPSGEGMMWHELYGKKRPLAETERRTSLQKAAALYMEKGGHFTASSFFILAQDLARVGYGPYAAAEEYEKVWDSMGTIYPFTIREEA